MKSWVIGGVSVVFGLISIVQGYSFTEAEWEMMDRIQAVIDERYEERGDGWLTHVDERLEQGQTALSGDDRAWTILGFAQGIVRRKMATIQIPYTMGMITSEEFYEMYSGYVTSPMDRIAPECLEHYWLVDSFAKSVDLPTSLVIATWWRERSCLLDNPTNGDGVFQILNNYYIPGPIEKFDLIDQIKDFVAITEGKWIWYNSLKMFDDLPVTLSYTGYDLLSIRKHSILYNGLAYGVTPENSRYANQNFGTGSGAGRDGIVAMMVKLVGWELEERRQMEVIGSGMYMSEPEGDE